MRISLRSIGARYEILQGLISLLFVTTPLVDTIPNVRYNSQFYGVRENTPKRLSIMLILRIHLQEELRMPGSSHHSLIAVCMTYMQHQDYPCHMVLLQSIALHHNCLNGIHAYFVLLFHAQQSYSWVDWYKSVTTFSNAENTTTFECYHWLFLDFKNPNPIIDCHPKHTNLYPDVSPNMNPSSQPIFLAGMQAACSSCLAATPIYRIPATIDLQGASFCSQKCYYN